MPTDDPVEVYSARNLTEAHLVRNYLADAGIEARIVGEALQSVLGDVPFQVASPRLWVKPPEAARALEVIAEYEAELQQSEGKADEAASTTNDESVELFCYHCGESLVGEQPVCPSCGGNLEWKTEESA